MVGLLLATACAEPPQPALPLVQIAEPLEVFPAVVSGVERVIELPDRRVAMLERFVPSVTILDWTAGTSSRFGRAGRGPGEFENPLTLLLIHPDTLMVPERLGRKAHLFTTGGEFVRSTLMPPGPFYTSAELFADTAGWIYLADPKSPVATLARSQDSLAIVRFRLGQDSPDSVWAVGTSPLVRMTTTSGAALLPAIFSAADAFGVSADGRIVRASANNQRLDQWQEGSERSLGPPWELALAPVTKRDRDSVSEVLAAVRAYQGIKPSFADQKAVFDEMVVGPDGQVWLGLTTPRDGVRVYRVFAADGAALYDFAPPAGSRLVGLGAAHAYFLRAAPDGLDELIRAPLPDRQQ